MSWRNSLQGRVGLALGLLLTVLWIATATITAITARHEMDEVFDSALQETAQRILPLAVVDILGRDDDATLQRLARIREHDEYFTYVVRTADGRVLLQSHAADADIFPPYPGQGFSQDDTYRFYHEEAVRGTLTMTIAEPLEHRRSVARTIQMALVLPLLVLVPITLLLVGLAVRAGLSPLRAFRDRLAARSARDLSPVAADRLPAEVRPLADTLNGVLARLHDAFEAERSFAANAAHELRTPLAGAIAQAQRIQAETKDPAALQRATDIETTLKRLTRLSERLMQLARAEGGRLRLDTASDLRPIAELVVADARRDGQGSALVLTLPDGPVLSDLDPDAFAIVCRNLIDNARRYGDPAAPVEVRMAPDGALRVTNACAVISAERLASLTERFQRGDADAMGSGLGLAIVKAIAERSGGALTLRSPAEGQSSGFEAVFKAPLGGQS